MTLNSHNNITPLTSIPSHITIIKLPTSKYKSPKPPYYLNKKSKTFAIHNNSYSTSP